MSSNQKWFFVLFVFLYQILALPSQAQNFVRYYNIARSQNLFGVDEASEGGYVFTGRTNESANLMDCWLAKVDSIGNMAWQKTFGGDFEDIGFVVHKTSDGGYLTGGIQGIQDDLGNGFGDALIVKTDENGDSLWTFLWNDSIESRAFVSSIFVPDTESYLIGGTVNAEVNGGPSRAFLISLDVNGTEQWTQVYDSPTHLEKVIPLDAGGYLVGGIYGSIYSTFPGSYLSKITDRGEVVWTKINHLGLFSGTITGLVETDDGCLLLSGNSKTQDFSNTAFVSKVSASGDLIWTKQYPNQDETYSYDLVTAANDNSFTFIGSTAKVNASPFELGDVWMVNFSLEGDTIWTKTYPLAGQQTGLDMALCSDGGYIIAVNDESRSDALLIKTDSLGDVDFTTSIFNPDGINKQRISSFPNPATTEIFINLPPDDSKEVRSISYTISDLSGRIVRKSTLENKYDTYPKLDITNLSSGLYFLLLNSSNRTYWTKFIKE